MFPGRKLSLRKEPDELIIHAAKNDTSIVVKYAATKRTFQSQAQKLK